jgi:hypothetical protein
MFYLARGNVFGSPQNYGQNDKVQGVGLTCPPLMVIKLQVVEKPTWNVDAHSLLNKENNNIFISFGCSNMLKKKTKKLNMSINHTIICFIPSNWDRGKKTNTIIKQCSSFTNFTIFNKKILCLNPFTWIVGFNSMQCFSFSDFLDFCSFFSPNRGFFSWILLMY